jgi:hypothetical protein
MGVWIRLAGSAQGPAADYFEHDNEASFPEKEGAFLDQLSASARGVRNISNILLLHDKQGSSDLITDSNRQTGPCITST